MANYAWEFGAEGTGLWYTITYNSETNELTVTSLEGKFDLNALWFGDGDNKAGEYGTTLSKADNSLNMNGSGVAWDGYVKLSSAGLGSAGEDKNTFISQGETQTFDLANFTSLSNLANFENSLLSGTAQIGVRATSVNGEGSIKSVGSEIPLPTIDVVKTASVETFDEGTPTDITYTYTVQNTSEHETFNEMTMVSLVDDNGTPGDTSDDINLLTGFVANLSYGVYYTGGDDGDYVLEFGETWNFSYTIEDVVENAGWTNTNTVTAVGESKNLQVSDTDDATVTAVNVDPGVEVTKVGSTNQVEDVGSVTYTYTVTNTSTASTDPLTLVSLVDDMGTPGDPLDDVNLLDGFVAGSSHGIHYTGGDVGNDYVLSQDEVWTFSYTTNVTVADGDSLTNVVAVNAKDDENNTVGDTAQFTVSNPIDGPPENPESPDFPAYTNAYSNVVFYLDTNGAAAGGIEKIKVGFNTGTNVMDLNDAPAVWDWFADNYLVGDNVLLAYTIHAGNSAMDTTGQIVTHANSKDPLHPGEGASLWLYNDLDPAIADYYDSTNIAGPTATPEMLALGINDSVLGASPDATFNYNGTSVG